MVFKHEIKKDPKEIIINIETYGQYVPLTISYNKDNFILEGNSKDEDKLKVLDFIIENFYTIMTLDKKRHFFSNGNGDLAYGRGDGVNKIEVIVDSEVREIIFWLSKEGKIEVSVKFPSFSVNDIIEQIKKIKNTFSDKNYEEILMNELKGEN